MIKKFNNTTFIYILTPIVTRLLAFINMEQYIGVRWWWWSSTSSQMSISNDTRQGTILSPFTWTVYADLLLKRLRRLGLGAHVFGKFMGAACFTEDVLLIAPIRSEIKRMLVELICSAN